MDRVIDTFGEKLVLRYRADTGKDARASQIVDLLAQADPTPNHEYTMWLAKLYLIGVERTPAEKAEYEARGQQIPPVLGIRRFEDVMSRAKPALAAFKKAKDTKKLPAEDRDINRLKSFAALENLVEPYRDIRSNKEVKSTQAQTFFDAGQAKLLLDDENVRVVIPLTEKASCYFGTNTKWCTAASEDNMFDHYNEEGPLYIILLKKENERYQIQYAYENVQAMDEEDNPIDVGYSLELAQRYPSLAQVLAPIASKIGSGYFNPNPSPECQLEIWKTSYLDLKYFDLAPEVRKKLLQSDTYNIHWIKNPTQAEQDYVVSKASSSDLRYIRNASVKTFKEIIRTRGIDYCPPIPKQLVFQMYAYLIQSNSTLNGRAYLYNVRKFLNARKVDLPEDQIQALIRMNVIAQPDSIFTLEDPSDELITLALKAKPDLQHDARFQDRLPLP